MEYINIIKEKYEKSVFENLDRENVNKIIAFLIKEKCDYIEDIIDDYLDLFNFQYEEFVEKYNKLNKELDGKFLEKASEDMNVLERFYIV